MDWGYIFSTLLTCTSKKKKESKYEENIRDTKRKLFYISRIFQQLECWKITAFTPSNAL